MSTWRILLRHIDELTEDTKSKTLWTSSENPARTFNDFFKRKCKLEDFQTTFRNTQKEWINDQSQIMRYFSDHGGNMWQHVATCKPQPCGPTTQRSFALPNKLELCSISGGVTSSFLARPHIRRERSSLMIVSQEIQVHYDHHHHHHHHHQIITITAKILCTQQLR